MLEALGANGLPICATIAGFTVSDPLLLIGTALSVKFDNASVTLNGGGALQVGAFAGAITRAAGATSTAFGAFGAMTVLANGTGASAVPTPIGPATVGQVFQALTSSTLGWGAVPLASLAAGPTNTVAYFNGSGALSGTSSLTGLHLTTSVLSNDLTTGVAGGQSIYGGTAAHDSITLHGTTAGMTSSTFGTIFIEDTTSSLRGSIAGSSGAALILGNFATVYSGQTTGNTGASMAIGTTTPPSSSPFFFNQSSNTAMAFNGQNFSSGTSASAGAVFSTVNAGNRFQMRMLGSGFATGPNALYAPSTAIIETIGGGSTGTNIVINSGSNSTTGDIDFLTGDTTRWSILFGGSLQGTERPLPAAPAAGLQKLFPSSADHNMESMNSSSVVSYMAYLDAGSAHHFLTTFVAPGSFTDAQPVEADVVNLVTDLAALTPTSRTVQGTAPIAVAGDHATHDLSANRVWSLDANGVTDAFFRQSGALAVVGRSANSTGNTADILATAASGAAFRESGSTIGWGTLATAAYSANSITYPKLQQGAGLTVLGVTGNATSNYAEITATGGTQCLQTNSGGTAVVWAACPSGGSGTVTTVTATVPLFITSTPTTTPNVTIQGAVITGSTSTSGTNLGTGTNGILEQTVSASVATVSQFNPTLGSVLFATSSGQVAQDNTGLFYDVTNHRLGMGTTTPGFTIDMLGNAALMGFRLTNNSAGSTSQIQNQLVNNAGALAYYGISSSAYSGFAPLNGGQAFFGGNAVDVAILTQGATNVNFYTTAIKRGQLSSGGNWVFSNAALATSATDGFVYLPTTAGVPSGTPTSFTGGKALIYDSTDNRLYVPNGASPKPIGQDTTGVATGPLCNTTTTGLWSGCSSANLATALGMPTAGQVDVSGGTGVAPVGDSNFTYNTTTHTLTSAGGNVFGSATGIATLTAGLLGTTTTATVFTGRPAMELAYYLELTPAILTTITGGNQYVATSSSAIVTPGAIEYPIGGDFVPQSCRLSATIDGSNPITSGSLGFVVMVNGSGSSFFTCAITITSASSGTVSTGLSLYSGTPASSDTIGVLASPQGSTILASGTLRLTIRVRISPELSF